MSFSVKQSLPLLFRIFFLGILLHFVLYTLVTFGFGRSGGVRSVVRLWKEFFVLCVLAVGFGKIIQRNSVSALKSWILSDSIFFYWLISFLGVLVVSFVSTIFVNHAGWSHRVVSLKYNLFPHVVFLAWYSVAPFFDSKTLKKTLSFVGITFVFCLLFALLWYVVIGLKPGALHYLGYDPLVYEGDIDHAPPAVYRSAYETGTPRNQFLFERPISWGFYLIAFWPLFFVLYLQKKPFLRLWFPWLLYVVNVFLTFSRAARGVWLIQTFILLLFTYRKHWKRIVLFTFFGLLLFSPLVLERGGSLFSRAFSDKGHLSFFIDGVRLFVSQPLLGAGGSSVGPGSHQFDLGFNPENQFLQVMIEYGLLGFLFRFLLYGYVFVFSWKSYCRLSDLVSSKRKATVFDEKHQPYRFLFALALGLFGLVLEGMVLHSFADRMIIYPLMASLGLVVGFLKLNAT